MKITFVRHSLLNRGGDKMIACYASHLADAGHQVVLKSNLVDSVFALSPRIAVHPLRFPGKLGTILSVLTAPAEGGLIVADIVAMVFLLSLRNRGRVLYFAQDYNENFYGTALQKLLIRLLYAVTLSWFRVPVLAVSDELALLFARRFKAAPRVIHNGVDLNTFYHDPSQDLLSGKAGRKAILFFSRRDYRKGFDLALATVARLRESGHDLVLWTVGEALQEGEVGCPRSDFGYVGEAQLRTLMSSADLFLYPSRSEGFPLMVLEAFACRCPVVTTEAIPYAVDGENALVARIGDLDALAAKAAQILGKPQFAHELADKAASFVLRYSLADSAREFEAALASQMEK